ncbi:hypothetical protein [Achromobacter xylosoxidans]|uniref:hypothetical protein n=1 Tax=Alcaligenes xylosoxydans xylosoxydans TaxID=85698 RepID=UPI001C52E13E|nr:hypothetical protein [Achromobacter xylosoxidans]
MPLYTVLQPIKAGGKLYRPGSESVELDTSVADDLVRSGYLSLAPGVEQAAAPAVPAAPVLVIPDPEQLKSELAMPPGTPIQPPAEPPNEPASKPSAAKPPAGTPPKMEGKAGQKAGNKAATPRKVAAKKSTPAKPA